MHISWALRLACNFTFPSICIRDLTKYPIAIRPIIMAINVICCPGSKIVVLSVVISLLTQRSSLSLIVRIGWLSLKYFKRY